MRVPAPREPRHGGRWETIRYALDTNPRTFRLCLILFVVAVGPCLGLIIAELIRQMLLCGRTGHMATKSQAVGPSTCTAHWSGGHSGCGDMWQTQGE